MIRSAPTTILHTPQLVLKVQILEMRSSLPKACDLLPERLPHSWPYTQPLTATMPMAAVAKQNASIRLGDAHKLIDGISAWWAVGADKAAHTSVPTNTSAPTYDMQCSLG